MCFFGTVCKSLDDPKFKVFIPEEVFKEVVERGKGKPGSKVIKEAAWIKAKPVKDKIQVAFLLGSLEKGEA